MREESCGESGPCVRDLGSFEVQVATTTPRDEATVLGQDDSFAELARLERVTGSGKDCARVKRTFIVIAEGRWVVRHRRALRLHERPWSHQPSGIENESQARLAEDAITYCCMLPGTSIYVRRKMIR